MSSNEERWHLLANDGGNVNPSAGSHDPFEALDDLMQVVEILCPTYPERDTFAGYTVFKL